MPHFSPALDALHTWRLYSHASNIVVFRSIRCNRWNKGSTCARFTCYCMNRENMLASHMRISGFSTSEYNGASAPPCPGGRTHFTIRCSTSIYLQAIIPQSHLSNRHCDLTQHSVSARRSESISSQVGHQLNELPQVKILIAQPFPSIRANMQPLRQAAPMGRV